MIELTQVVAEQTVYHSAQHPSRLVLSELPEPEFAESWMKIRWRKAQRGFCS